MSNKRMVCEEYIVLQPYQKRAKLMHRCFKVLAFTVNGVGIQSKENRWIKRVGVNDRSVLVSPAQFRTEIRIMYEVKNESDEMDKVRITERARGLFDTTPRCGRRGLSAGIY